MIVSNFVTKGVTTATSRRSPPIINRTSKIMNYDASCPKEKLEFNFFSSPGIEWFYAVCQKVSLVKVQNLEEDAGDL